VARDIADVNSPTSVDTPTGPARRQLVEDLAAHGALLARIGERLQLPGYLVARARDASEAANEGRMR
jgi:hypothetical protein